MPISGTYRAKGGIPFAARQRPIAPMTFQEHMLLAGYYEPADPAMLQRKYEREIRERLAIRYAFPAAR